MKRYKKHNKIFLCGALGAMLCAGAIVGVNVNNFTASAAEDTGVRTVSSYFSAMEDASFSTNVDTPTYVKNARNGVLVESAEAGTLVYDNVIETNDLTKDDLLVEVQLTPKTIGTTEFNQLLIRLEDSEDPKCYVEVSLYKYCWGDNSKYKLTYVTVTTNTIAQYKSLFYELKNDGTKEQPIYTGVTPKLQTNVNQGTMILGSFVGSYGGVSDPISIYYDDTEHALYTKNVSSYTSTTKSLFEDGGHVDEEGRFLVLDMDNATYMGTQKSNLWTGFPSGKAKMSFKTQEVESTADFARYMILTIDNQTMEGTMINDTTAPKLTVDVNAYTEESLPTAQVGKYYSFFNAYAFDKMYGDVVVSKHLYKDGKEQYCTGDGFIPTTAGEYRLDYVAYDGNRNKVEKSLSITAEDGYAEISGTFIENNGFSLWDESLANENGKFETALYYPVVLPTMIGDGGRGNVSVSVSVKYNGKELPLEKNTFRPEYVGDYTVTYTLTDYIGNIKEYEYIILADYSDVPELQAPVLPTHIPVGKPYCFPAVQSNFYSLWQQALTTYRKISVYKADGSTLITSFENDTLAVYTPTLADGETIVVEYLTAANATAKAVTYRTEMQLVPFEKLSDLYVLSDGVTFSSGMSDMRFTFTNENQSVKFINALSIYDGIEITFVIPDGKENFDYVEFILRDKYDKDLTMSIALFKDAEATYVSINGGEKKVVDLSYVGGGNFRFKISKNGEFYNYNDDIVTKAQDFEGFTSGFIYMEFSLNGISGDDATIGMKKIKNQSMINAPFNYIKPSLTVYKEPVGTVNLNEEVALSGAIASDVYDGNAKINVIVTFNEKVLYTYTNDFGTFDGYTFKPNDYGLYVIEYIAEDASGNTLSKMYNVVVRDVIKPTIELSGGVPTTGKVGKALSLPKAIAKDNVDADLQVYVIVINPMNAYTLMKVGDSYVPQYAGRYIVKFYCEDTTYNTVYTIDYVIHVS